MANTLELHQLPPTKDELTQHIIHVNYQAYVWKRALETKLDIPTPTGHGCKRKEISSLSCGWKISKQQNQCPNLLPKSNCTNLCQCRVLSMEYTDIFKCRGIMSKVIMMRLKRTIKKITLTTKPRIFDTYYQILYLSYIADILEVYIPEVSSMFIFQALARFQS